MNRIQETERRLRLRLRFRREEPLAASLYAIRVLPTKQECEHAADKQRVHAEGQCANDPTLCDDGSLTGEFCGAKDNGK